MQAKDPIQAIDDEIISYLAVLNVDQKLALRELIAAFLPPVNPWEDIEFVAEMERRHDDYKKGRVKTVPIESLLTKDKGEQSFLSTEKTEVGNCKSGSERLVHNGKNLERTLLDFWRWSASDVLSNATRGRFAEFIVATATNTDINQMRDEWSAYDLTTAEGIKLEIKSAAYLQSWEQSKLSAITFSTKPARLRDAETRQRSEVGSRSADVYVFCLLKHQDKATINPLDLSQWEFYVLATRQLNEYTRSQHSITLKSLQRLTAQVNYNDLHAEVIQKNHLNYESRD